MNENANRAPAKIYQFPAGGRAGLEARRESSRPAADVIQDASAKVVIGGSWYHEEAIVEASDSRKH